MSSSTSPSHTAQTHTSRAAGQLRDYGAKRDLTVSGEPASGTENFQPRFVIQRHDATTLHFDFRLEADEVLKSWAVPKGPSTDPRQKRLARRTEDHPIDYAEFEGRIPEGEYGAGTVVVWDAGSYTNLTQRDGVSVPVGRAIDDGHVKVWLHGQKIRGGFALSRMRSGEGAGRDWLLVKVDDEGADRRRKPERSQPESVLSGRSNEDMADE